jgi:uncharacterized FlaG/YvyC family protein
MGPISVIAERITTSSKPVVQASEGPTPEERALNRTVAIGVQALNEAGYVGQGREVTFSVDPATRRPVVKVVDTATKEVLQQWPPEYLLQLAADTKKLTRDSG